VLEYTYFKKRNAGNTLFPTHYLLWNEIPKFMSDSLYDAGLTPNIMHLIPYLWVCMVSSIV